MANKQVKEMEKQYAETFNAQHKQAAVQQKRIEDLLQLVALSKESSVQSTRAKMTDTQAVLVTISKLPPQSAADGDENSDTSPKERSVWQKDDEDQRNEWKSPLATKIDDVLEETLGNQGDDLESLSDTDKSEDDSNGSVRFIESILPHQLLKDTFLNHHQKKKVPTRRKKPS